MEHARKRITSSEPTTLDQFDVCVITTIHPPFDARIYQRELTSLVEAGLSVCLVAPWPRPKQADKVNGWIFLQAPRARWQRIGHGFRTFKAAMGVNCRTYVFHDLDFLPWAVLLRRLKKVPVVYDCHENYPEEILYGKDWIPRQLRRGLAALVRAVEDWGVRNLDAVVTVVPHQIRRFTKLGAKCVMVRNFSSEGSRPDVPHDKALVYAGSVSRNYGSDVLLAIGRELKRRDSPVSLVVSDRFRGNESLRRDFVRTVELERLPIRLEPQVPSFQLDRLLAKGSIGIFVAPDTPNKRFAYPSKLFDYMAMGMPIVASDLEATRELIEGAECGVLVPPGDAVGLVEEALRILETPERYQAYRRNALRAAESLYHWRHEEQRLIWLIRYLRGDVSVPPW